MLSKHNFPGKNILFQTVVLSLYYIEFTDCVKPTFTVTNAEPDSADGTDRDKDPTPAIYTIVENDTLWGIAQCYLGDGLRWEEIYELNKDVIEDTAWF